LYLFCFFAYSSFCRKPFCICSTSLYIFLIVGNHFVFVLLHCTVLLVGNHFVSALLVVAQFFLKLLQETELLHFADHCSLEFLYESDVPRDSVFNNLQETRLIWIDNLLTKMEYVGLPCFIVTGVSLGAEPGISLITRILIKILQRNFNSSTSVP
jgi:hypothetical protein